MNPDLFTLHFLNTKIIPQSSKTLAQSAPKTYNQTVYAAKLQASELEESAQTVYVASHQCETAFWTVLYVKPSP